MELPIIESMTASLPVSEMGEIQADHEIWEETDGGAHFKVTKHRTVTPDGDAYKMVALTVSGKPAERLRVIYQFAGVFGTAPDGRDVNLREEDGIDTLIWVIGD